MRQWPRNPPAQIHASTARILAKRLPTIQTLHQHEPMLPLRARVRKSPVPGQTIRYSHFPLEYTRCCAPKVSAIFPHAFGLDCRLPRSSPACGQIRPGSAPFAMRHAPLRPPQFQSAARRSRLHLPRSSLRGPAMPSVPPSKP